MSTAQARLQQFTDIRILSIVAAFTLLGDLVTTMYGLSIGLPEANPFVAPILDRYGILSLVVLKGVAVAWCVFIYSAMEERYAKAALLGLFVPQAVAVVLNVLTIAQA